MITLDQDFYRRIINTGNIIMAQKTHLIPGLVNKYPGDYIDVDSLNNLRVEQPTIIPATTIRDMYGRYSYGSAPFGSGAQIQAVISITNIKIGGSTCTPGTSGTPGACVPPNITCQDIGCIGGVTTDITVTFTNTGTADGTIIPTLSGTGSGISIPSDEAPASITIPTTGPVDVKWTNVVLSRGNLTICVNY